MSNDHFQFRRFTVRQERCAMKVGTDGTLLGAWAALPVAPVSTVLDIGTGTGLIALMMAQRFPEASVTAIDIDSEAVAQAKENVLASPFRNIVVARADVRTFNGRSQTFPGSPLSETASTGFAAIVCNPPYFVDSLKCPDSRRTLARHTTSLNYSELMAAVCRLLADEGEFSLVIPADSLSLLLGEAALAGLFLVRRCAVKTTPKKPPRRFLLAFGKHPREPELAEEILETAPGVRSPWYRRLTNDFYL